MAGIGHAQLEPTSLAGTWLSTRLGIDRVRLERMAASGALLSYRPAGSQERYFPAWQFDAGATSIPELPLIREAGRRAGLDDERLCAVMERRVGLGGTERLRDLARQGRVQHVLACIAEAAREPRD